MQVGTLELVLVIRGAHSLKEKRRVITTMKDQIRSKFQVSVAEVDDHDSWQRAVIGVALVGTEGRHLTSVLSKVVDHVRRFRGAELADYRIDVLYGDG